MNPGNAMDPIQWFATLGVNGILAGVMFYFYKQLNERTTEYMRSQNELIIQVVKENTKSNTELVLMVDAMHRRMDDEGRSFRATPRPPTT